MPVAERRKTIVIALLGLAAAALILVLGGHATEPAPAPAAGGAASLQAAAAAPHAPADRPAMRGLVTACREAGVRDAGILRELALSHPDPLIAAQAIAALGRLRRVAGDPALLALADDARPRVRHELTIALGLSQDRVVVPLLERRLQSADRDECRLAILALVALGERERLCERVPASERAFATAALQARPAGRLLGTTAPAGPR